MEQSWRWFGPKDRVTLRDAREAGAAGIVTALHEVPMGEVWPVEQIRQRQQEIERAGLEWSVVESRDVTEALKMRGPRWQRQLDNWKENLRCHFAPIMDRNFSTIENAPRLRVIRQSAACTDSPSCAKPFAMAERLLTKME